MISLPSFPRREARDAARLALQSGVAAAATFSLMEAADLPEKFVGVLSAVLVVQPTVGSTLGAASTRFVATVVGCALGVLSLALVPSGYGTAIALAIAVAVIHLVAGFRPEWRYGAVAAVALALGSDGDLVVTATERSIAIGLGVVVGALVTLVVWPDRAEVRAARHLRSALRATADRLDIAGTAVLEGRVEDADDERRRFHREFDQARQAAKVVRFHDTETLERKIDAIERLYNSVLFLNRVAEEMGDQPVDESGVKAWVESFRHAACDLARRAAGDDPSDDTGSAEDRLREIREALEATRTAVSEATMEPHLRTLRYALVFSMNEIEDGLTEIYELVSAD